MIMYLQRVSNHWVVLFGLLLVPGRTFGVADDEQHQQDLLAVVRRANETLEQKYSILAPKLLTVERLREAIRKTATKLAESDDSKRHELVETLQEILHTERLPRNVKFHVTPMTVKHKPGPPHFGRKAVSLNYTLLIPTGPKHVRMVGLMDLLEMYRIEKGTRAAGGEAQWPTSTRTEAARGDATFLQPGTWWNLFSSEGENPLGGRSIRAVKVLEIARRHPSWVKTTFPKSEKEHRSIFGPAAKAHKNQDVQVKDALAEWEKSVTEWTVRWVNLAHVVHASMVGE